MPDWYPSAVYREETRCEHEETIATKHTKKNDAICVYLQCVNCGEKIKEVSKRDYNINALPDFDETLRMETRERNNQRLSELNEQYNAELNDEDRIWKEKYNNEYLNSEHWQNLREVVRKRDNYTCQNCFCEVGPSDPVHHLSYVGYNTRGYSFAFECVTLCNSCHEDYHGIETSKPEYILVDLSELGL